MEFLQTPILTEADAEGFFFQLYQAGLLFHPEDNPADVVNARTGQPTFTPEQVELVRAREIACDIDGRAHFMAWGTCRIEGSDRVGSLNKHNLI